MWVGDLRLQALVNYESFRSFKMVKRCLYLFARLTNPEGYIAHVFMKYLNLVFLMASLFTTLYYTVALCMIISKP